MTETPERSFIVPEEIANLDRSGWIGSGGGFNNLVQKMPVNKSIVIRLMNNPTTCNRNEDFTIYREAGAWEGLVGGHEMPGGLKEFPVFDQDLVYDDEGNIIGRVAAPRGTDLLFESVKPDKYAKRKGYNRAQASDMMVFNAVVESGDFGGKEEFNPKPGTHILLKMSKKKGVAFIRGIEERIEENEDFDPLAGAWKIALVGESPTYELTMTRVTKNIEPIDEDEWPEMINVAAYMQDVRLAAEAFFATLDGSAPASDGTDESFTAGEDEAIDDFEEEVTKINYAAIAPARLKTLLTEAGVKIPARATTSKLIELAEANL